MTRILGLFALLSVFGAVSAQAQGGSSQAPLVTTAKELAITARSIVEPFTPRDVQVGDPEASYFNVEITPDHRYMVWIEVRTDGSGLGVVWHCAIDAETAALVPPDCRGFRAFDSTWLNRANVGVDSRGVFYAGADRSGHVILVRPTGPASATTVRLPTAPDPTRRAFYPSLAADSDKAFIAWIKNEKVPGAGTDPRNAWVELQYIDIAAPAQVRVIERQDRPAFGFAPMDSEFFRWVAGRAAMTFGSVADSGRRELKELDLAGGSPKLRFVTNDRHRKSDPYPFVFGDTEVLVPGIDFQPVLHVLTRPLGTTGLFKPVESITVPAETRLANPFLAQSAEPIVRDGKAYVAYQVNDRGQARGFFQLLSQPGEIWLSTLLQAPQKQWRLSSPEALIRTEPEPFVGRSRAWVFYSAAPPGSTFARTAWQLRRTDTPVGVRPP